MRNPVELRTYTGLWQVEKKIYRLYDITLPMPVSVRQLGMVIAVGVPWVVFMKLIGVPFAPPFGHLFWLAPPALAAWAANRPLIESKKLGALLASNVKFLLQPKWYARMRPFTDAEKVGLYADVWHKGNPVGTSVPDELPGDLPSASPQPQA